MSETTGISWTDSTFNSWMGCTKVSPACDHCYAERDTKRFGRVEWGAGKPRVRTVAANWAKPKKWNVEPFYECLTCHERGDAKHMIGDHNHRCPNRVVQPARRRVFCASLADWLDNEVPIEWLVDLLDLIRQTPNLDWLNLSKRIGNFKPRLTAVAAHIRSALDAQTERETSLQAGESGRAGDRFQWSYLAGEETHRQPLDRRDAGDSLQARARGVSEQPRLSSGSGDDQWRAAPCLSGAAGVAALQRADHSAHDGEPQRRREAEQPSVELGTGDVQPAAPPRNTGIGGTTSRRARLETPENTPHRVGGNSDARSAKSRNDGQDAGRAVRPDTKSSVSNLSRLDLETLLVWIENWLNGTPPANVWLGSTVINQEEADRDVPKLLNVPARVRFLSMEPLLGPVCLRQAHKAPVKLPRVDWVIAGGESGPHARPMHPDWARSLRDQCAVAGVPFFVKQLSVERGRPIQEMALFPEDLRIQEYPHAIP